MQIENGLMRLLYNYLSEYKKATRDELRIFAYQNNFDLSTANRKLRLLTQGGYIKPEVGTKGFNKIYKIKEKQLTLI